MEENIDIISPNSLMVEFTVGIGKTRVRFSLRAPTEPPRWVVFWLFSIRIE
jgi:hypothetical protein